MKQNSLLNKNIGCCFDRSYLLLMHLFFFGKEKNTLRKENPAALELLMAKFYYIITMLSHLFSAC